jgi:hypothetical protein
VVPAKGKHDNTFSYLTNSNLLNGPNLALDISDFPEFRAKFCGTVADTTINIHILHNHNFWWAMSVNFISIKAIPHVTM